MTSLLKRVYTAFHPPTLPKSTAPEPLKFGILGAANIGPFALILPAKSHPEVVIYAVAARSLTKAQTYANKHGIEKAYEGYQAMLDDPEVDVVYNALPNALHYEWTMKALMAGKHVLNEKPFSDTAEEAREMFELAEKKGLVLLEAFHYRFHPAVKRAKEIIKSGEIGAVKEVSVDMLLPRGSFSEGDIRYDFSLGGGAFMDLGTYAMNSIRYFSSSNPTSVVEATYEAFEPKSPPPDYVKNVDRRMEVKLELGDITAIARCDFALPNLFGIIPRFPQINLKVQGDKGSLEMFNFILPTIYHSITVKTQGGSKRVERVYKAKEGKGEDWWTTWRFQLDAMVDRVRGREPDVWIAKGDTLANMEWIEKVYEKSGLGRRPRTDPIVDVLEQGK
ncbi:hypothetical protein CPB84DRAFT_1770236 [Gymnopilus junonius]|uniref:D-xylose 1-dehydrogenase (NADP(+), D-xylono-1,5-lactone-forming) n=1 Tax=Gymnopilus junonius TaxID=109634 RepID=A0A9P5NW35_GYMJU|nr:hypothetical protein CPB84DRAFT_1770236 [Gymnopilus junonius]